MATRRGLERPMIPGFTPGDSGSNPDAWTLVLSFFRTADERVSPPRPRLGSPHWVNRDGGHSL